MANTPASIGSGSADEISRRPAWADRASPLRQGAARDIRRGTHEPASLTLVARGTLPLTAVAMLALCMLAGNRPLSMQFWAIALVTFLASAQVFSPLDLRTHERSADRTRRAAPRIILEWSCVAAILSFIEAALRTPALPRDILMGWFLATPIALLLVDSLRVPIVKRLAAARSAAQRYVIIGANDVGIELARRIAQGEGGGVFCGFLDHRAAERLPILADRPVTPGCKALDFVDFVRRHSVTRVYIALPLSTAPRIDELLKSLRDTTVSVYFVPNIFAFDLVQPRCLEINGMPAFSICDSPLQGLSALWKRGFDFSLALVLLLLLWPVLLALAMLIKLSSPGPALFKQRRYGLNGEEILVYKFRSMTVCEDGPVVQQASRFDHRITPVGAFLRRTSMDELPQILNVLEGKMSFVGPRPHAVAHNEQYRKLINGYMIRHKMRPGITGWAQVNGLRGETSSFDKMQQRVQYDIDYLNNWSMTFDLKIIARTALTVLFHSNAY